MTRRIRVALALAAFPALLAGLVACSPAAAPQRDCGSSGCRTPVSCGASKSPQAPTTPVAVRTEPVARLLEQAVPGEELALPAGVFTFSDFRPVPEEQRLGMDVPSRVSGIIGAGTRATAFRMVPRSSTAAGAVPTEFPQSNRLSLMRVTGPSPRLSGFSLLGSEQGHPYNGLLVERTTGARITDLCVAGVPGTDHQPPGETFGIADYRTVGSVYRRIQVDGRHVGAAGFGANVSRNLTVIDSRFFDNRYSAGATFWEVDGITLRNVASVGNGLIGLNFERVGGQVHLVHCVTRGNGDGDLRITSDFSSAQYTIEDPVTADGHLTVVLPPTYLGRPNLQRRADVRVLVHGVDRTADVVRFVGG